MQRFGVESRAAVLALGELALEHAEHAGRALLGRRRRLLEVGHRERDLRLVVGAHGLGSDRDVVRLLLQLEIAFEIRIELELVVAERARGRRGLRLAGGGGAGAGSALAGAGVGSCARARIGPSLAARARVELLRLLRVAEVALPDVRHHDVRPRALLGRLGQRRLLLAELEHGLPAAARLVDAAELAQRAPEPRLELNRLGVGADRRVGVGETLLADLGEAHRDLGALPGVVCERGSGLSAGGTGPRAPASRPA